MNKSCLKYFEEEDVLHLLVSDELEIKSVDLSSNITVELNDKNELIGVEILKATEFVLDMLQESLQARADDSLRSELPTTARPA